MKGFAAYHITSGRSRYLDQLFVKPRERRKGVASLLLFALANGPIELIVDMENCGAIALYTLCGFCAAKECTYEVDDGHLCMKTTSYLRTKSVLRPRARTTARVTYHTWSELKKKDQSCILNTIRKEWGVSATAAKETAMDDDMRFAVCN